MTSRRSKTSRRRRRVPIKNGWLRPGPAAALVGCGYDTLRAMATDGRIPKHALIICGGSYRVARWWCEGGLAHGGIDTQGVQS